MSAAPRKRRGRPPVKVWVLLWSVGLAVWFVTVPGLVAYLAGTRLEVSSDGRGFPWRLVFVAVTVAVGGYLAWLSVGRDRRRRAG